MFYNISCTPKYSRHSPEVRFLIHIALPHTFSSNSLFTRVIMVCAVQELRIAYMKSGRQLNSDEIIAQNAVLRMS